MKAYGAFWLYTVLRFGLFFGLWAVLWLVGVPLLFAGVIALALSVPLSLVLLAKPRHAFAAAVEARVEQRRRHAQAFDARLAGGRAVADQPDGSNGAASYAPGVTEAPPKVRRPS